MRFSDPSQAAGHSRERQEAYASKWAAEHGLQLDNKLTMLDEGLSAYHQRHVTSGALGAFLAGVQAGRIEAGSVLVVEGLDRLSRAEPIQAQAQLAQIVNAGITVVTASDGKAYSRERLKANPMDLVYSLLLMIRAHEESDTKSKRVKASIRWLCEGWQAGTYRGRIRQGHDPEWLREVPGGPNNGWELVPERVAAVRRAVALYVQGAGGLRIMQVLDAEGLELYTTSKNHAPQFYRLIKMPQLVGNMPVRVDGEEFLLEGYYPGVLSHPEWEELCRVRAQSGRRRVKGDLPHVITGIGITTCGYCGRAMCGQNLASKKRLPDGRIRDGYRRLLCASNASYGDGCSVKASTSVAPIERALMKYCSDIINLQALFGTEGIDAPRARAASARAKVAEINTQLEKVTDAMLATSSEGTPQVFARRARALEKDLHDAESALRDAELELGKISRRDLRGADQAWRDLAAGVEAQDVEARLRARQLVADTFERIVIYARGIRPDPEASERDYCIDIVLVGRGGNSRLLQIDREGNLLQAEDVAHLQAVEVAPQVSNIARRT